MMSKFNPPSLKMPATIQHQLDHWQQQFEQLQPREQLALKVLAVFLLIVLPFYGTWALHQGANNAAKQANEQRQTLSWMQSQAPFIQQPGVQAQSLEQQIQAVAQQQALNVATVQTENMTKLTVAHQNYAILANFLTQIVASGGIAVVEMDWKKNVSGLIELNCVLQAR